MDEEIRGNAGVNQRAEQHVSGDTGKGFESGDIHRGSG